MIAETERLILREMSYDDSDALYRVLGDSENMKYYPYSFDKERVRGWIDRNIERYRRFGFGLWAVCLKDTGEMIGDCGLTMQMINGIIRPEIGYHIRRDMQRRGYAKEAACKVRDMAFEDTPFNEIYSVMKHTNEASARTALSYGCRYMGEYADDANGRSKYYMITRDEWEMIVCTERKRQS
ncbi:MAG: GNAT family N-acetyltransferase [Oscillospiraceae bacterium]|nr:GNAT family N-acetyltransferase [Oscillospiraceae bacterium]